jgi:DNA-binding XRE family transcriptional regulator
MGLGEEAMTAKSGKDGGELPERNAQMTESHHRKIIITEEAILASPLLERLADTLLCLQGESGLTKPEFANKIDVGFSQLYVIMKGDSNPSLLVAEEIARRLGISIWQLLGVESMDGHGYALPGPRRKRRK